jgi:hypothetical protein
MADATADGKADLNSLAYNLDITVLKMFNAFNRTLRAKVEKMRQAIAKHYGVNISNPTRKGRQILDNILGDIFKLVNINYYANRCIAFTSRLLHAAIYLSCRKG